MLKDEEKILRNLSNLETLNGKGYIKKKKSFLI